MRRAGVFGCLVVLWGLPGLARGGFVTYTDEAAFRAAAGALQEIDFETLPDGSPSFSGALITPEFNYTDQGVEFSPHNPFLQIVGNPISGFGLRAGLDQSEGPRNWIIAELLTPATAVGILFPGGTNISIFGTSGVLIATDLFGDSGPNFGGFISDVPIGSVITDAGIEVELIDSFLFTPVPEPAMLLLLSAGSVLLIRRRRWSSA